jgi:hypothetical protein
MLLRIITDDQLMEKMNWFYENIEGCKHNAIKDKASN